ncbi:MAG: signal peptidase, partial [Verrucomicrobiales bacterium]|nr:signal peptidase [Verrucomicrobiales bacterium]
MSSDFDSPASVSASRPARLPFFKPGWMKKGVNLSKGVQKFVQYNRDLMPADKLAKVIELQARHKAALGSRDQAAAEVLEKELVQSCEGAVPQYKSSVLKENVEVIVVAIVVALGIRAYFLQPFKIPTASMQPTLNGITAKAMPDGEAFP